MKIISKSEINISELKDSVFIYPTDTIYGIGCDATDKELVSKIREVKHRPDTPFSVIVPSKKWIYENCVVSDIVKKWIDKLPGKYTLILKLKNRKVVSENVSFSDTIGVRIPDHWISEIVSNLGFPIVTTSVNFHGEKNLEKIGDLDENFKENVDIFIDEGAIKGSASKIVDLTKKEEKVTDR